MSGLADESIIPDFVAESREHLDAIEPDLLVMERGGSPHQDVINRVFRAIHSIKGGAGFLAFESLKQLSHAMEGVLMLLRDGRLALSVAVMDALFAGLDRLRAMLADIQASDRVPCGEELDRLNAILAAQGQAPGVQVKARSGPGQAEAREFDLDDAAVRRALNKGMNLFHAQAHLHRDIRDKGFTPLAWLRNALSVGHCLEASIDTEAIADLQGCLERDLAISLLFASVLDAELAALALKLPQEQVAMLDMPALREALKTGLKARAAGDTARDQVDQVPEPADPAPEGGAAPSSLEDEDSGAPVAARSEGAAPAETLRVRVDLLTQLMNQAGELVLSRNQLFRAVAGHSRSIPGLTSILQDINQVTTELQEGIMQTRMQPIGTVFSRFPRVIRDLSRQLGKRIRLDIQGAEVELDKSIVELLVDPLTHIIRNCADHALEPPEERERTRKHPTGLIRLHAYHQGGQVIIAVSDDGRGIDPGRVRAKAIARGVVTEGQARDLTEREIVNLVFAPGFSTAETVSEISGRGVGMDVVRSNTEKLGGHVELESRVGVGTTVRLRLPLTLAIIPSMIVGVEGQRFAMPQVNVVEFVWVKAADAARRIERIHGAEVLRLRDELLPLVRLADLLGLERSFQHPGNGERLTNRRMALADRRSRESDAAGRPDGEEGTCDAAQTARAAGDRRGSWPSDHNIVVLRLGSSHFGVVVDELFDIEEIVVKPLSGYIQNCKCFSGATILGDGRVIMILDAGGLAAQARLHFADLQEEGRQRHEEERRKEAMAASRRRSVLLCAGAPGEYFAVPQDRIQRLEKIRTGDIQRVGLREFVDYRGHGLPLLRLDSLLDVRPVDPAQQELFLIIPKILEGGASAPAKAGLVISDILDALDVEVELEDCRLKGPGVLGSAILQHKLTLFLEPLELLQAAGLMGGEPR